MFENLIANDLWICGPEFVCEPDKYADILVSSLVNIDELPETRKVVVCDVSVIQCDVSLFSRYSSFDKLLNVMLYVMHFVDNCKLKSNCKSRYYHYKFKR